MKKNNEIEKLLKGKVLQGLSIDREARAVYFTLSDKDVFRTERIHGSLSIDYDKDGKVVGIEIIRIVRMKLMIEKALKDIRQALPQSIMAHC